MNNKYVLLLNAHTNYKKGCSNTTYKLHEYNISCQINYLINNYFNFFNDEGIKSLIIDTSHIKPYSKSLHKKTEIIKNISNNFDILAIETHLNAFNKLVSGWEILVHEKNINSSKFANILKDNSTSLDINKFRGIKKRDNIHVLNDTKDMNYPVILFEPWFLDNDKEAKKCNDINELANLAHNIYKSIIEYFGQ